MNTLLHSPADILRWALIGLGEGTNPAASPLGAWPIHVAVEPDAPDSVATIVGTVGTDHARDMFAGMHVLYGFQVLVRSATYPVGRLKADAIRAALAPLDKLTIPIPGSSSRYTINAVPMIGQVLELGFESPTSKRQKFSVNGQVSITQAA